MPTGPTSSPGPAADGNPQDGKPAGGPRRVRYNTTIAAAVITAAGAITAAVATGAFGLLGNPSASPSSPPPGAQECSGFRADVEIPSRVGPYPALTFHFYCAPAAGQQYLWVVEADGIGKDDHTEYYPKPFKSEVRAGATFTTSLDVSKDRIGEQNCIVVISVTTAQYEDIESNLNGNNFTLQLPDSVAQVSAPACEKRER